ncbi:MAG: nitroreductase [Cellvibrio sp.]|jgi:nitroreductase|nr:nitroreductase [Cellvibrio sp.]
MNLVDVLQKRQSVGRLQAPAPDQAQCEALILAAIRAADHGNLTPWRFLLIQDQGLVTLGDVFLEAAKITKSSLTGAEEERLLTMPRRAPLILIVIARIQEHPKIPQHEQLYSAAAAAQNILNAAYAMGFGAIWRTGEMASHPHVANRLGLTLNEQIIGFLYIGTPVQPLGEAKIKPATDFLTYWA